MSARKTLACLGALACAVFAARGEMLTLTRTIPLPRVEGRIDHFALDVAGGRLFVAALGNNTVEVIDLKAGQVMHTIAGLAEPQGIFYVPGLNRLFVANGGDGALRVFDGTTFAVIATVKFSGDADNVRYDAATQRLYVGYGGGALGVVDTVKNSIAADIPLGAHPESFQLEKDGGRIFVNVPGARQISVVDHEQQKVVATWPTDSAAANFPMALDEPHHRLFVVCRTPARLLMFDTGSGRELASLGLHGDCDDLYVDAPRHQLYASCGEGFIDIFTQTNADPYALKESVPTVAKARTCFFDGRQIYLAVPKAGARDAEVRIYDVL
jgi:YVTN family beta-propeller protein